ncbi:hypothetical protein Pmar_PMAR000297, partial [Perkinsus marinus ATCC 50983]
VKQSVSHSPDVTSGLVTCLVEWERTEDPGQRWVGRGSGRTKDEAEVRALKDIYAVAAPWREKAAVAQ